MGKVISMADYRRRRHQRHVDAVCPLADSIFATPITTGSIPTVFSSQVDLLGATLTMADLDAAFGAIERGHYSLGVSPVFGHTPPDPNL